PQRRLPRRRLSQPGGDHVAHDAFVHLFRFNFGATHRFGHNLCAELRRGERRQPPLEFPYGRAHCAQNDGGIHGGTSFLAVSLSKRNPTPGPTGRSNPWVAFSSATGVSRICFTVFRVSSAAATGNSPLPSPCS